MASSTPEETLREQVLNILPKLDVNDGKYQLIFTQGYMLIWKYIRDYAKAVGLDPSKINKQGRTDPIFTTLNHYMYPLGQEPLTREAAASEILAAAESYLARIH